MIKSIVHCIDQLDSGTSFGVRQDTGESVFIPASIAKRIGLNVGDIATATLLVNATRPDKTPWFAAFMDQKQTASTLVAVDETLGGVEQLLGDTAGYYTTEEVAEECGIAVAVAAAKLELLFSEGRVSRANVRSHPNTDVAFVLWAGSADNFVSEENV